jgi:hypothetical protein
MGLHPPPNDGAIGLTVVAVFFAGMILGSLLIPYDENRVERCAHGDFTS